MARTKKDETEQPSKKGVKYSEVKPKGTGLQVNRKDYMAFLDIYHLIRPYIDRKPVISKEELIKKFPKRKKMVEDVWECIYDLKLVWPHEIIGRILNND